MSMPKVDEPIQKELEHVDQEIEVANEITKYQKPEDVFYDCVTQDEAEEEKSASSAEEVLISSAERLLASRSVEEVSASLAKDLLASRSA
jgi:hypothetical protein